MKRLLLVLATASLAACSSVKKNGNAPTGPILDDPYLSLENIESPESLAWVKRHNEKSLPTFEHDPRYKPIEGALRKIMLAQDRIPQPTLAGGYVYNFWQDGKHVRGLYRRATLAEYARAKPKWELLLDLDRLAAEENENWVWKTPICLRPHYDRCLLQLSRGGKDAVVIREFDVEKREFVKDGFNLPEAKSGVAWASRDAIAVGTDFGPGSATLSGYPRLLKFWKRGEPLSQARKVLEVGEKDMAATPFSSFRPEGTYVFLRRTPSFFEEEVSLLNPVTLEAAKLPLPADANVQEVFDGRLLFELRSDWIIRGNRFVAGSLVSLKLDSLDEAPELVYEPGLRGSIEGVSATKNFVYVTALENVAGQIFQLEHGPQGWSSHQVALPPFMRVSVAADDAFGDVYLTGYEGFLTPPTVAEMAGLKIKRVLKQMPARFAAGRFVVKQYEATSRDGTRVPYFAIHAKGLKYTGKTPTILYGYGGFEIPITPNYLSVAGKVWLERGGVFALANIRGGGEFGPRWHQAALKENRQRAYDDFAAVAEDLIGRKITSPAKLGITGRSNGGLLMGVMLTQRPELFNAIVCGVPLLDMLRYTKLLAGHSWMAEYGNPEVSAEREAILRYSPYQNARPGVAYPKVFFMTSTKDDRVHPGHARKMVARLEEQGHDVYYFENTEGGHGAAANLEQKIRMYALEYTYFSQRLGL